MTENILRAYAGMIVIFLTHDPQLIARVDEVVDLQKVNAVVAGADPQRAVS